MPNPQAAAPQPGGGDASPQADPLQQMLGKVAMVLKQLGAQNTMIQPEMDQATSAILQALQKSSQAAPGNPQQAPTVAPPQQ